MLGTHSQNADEIFCNRRTKINLTQSIPDESRLSAYEEQTKNISRRMFALVHRANCYPLFDFEGRIKNESSRKKEMFDSSRTLSFK